MSDKSRKTSERKLFYFAVALILSSFLLMGQVAGTLKKAEDDDFWEFTAMFSEIYKEIRDRYVEPVDAKKLFEGALQGMFLTLDPHSQFMDPDNYTQLEKDTEGAFSGVGIHITLKDGVLTVIAPIPGSPAAKAGIRPWDRIIEIEGKKTEGITLIDAVKKLTGPSGTTVKVTVYREGEGELLHFDLIRKNIRVESVYSKMLDDKVGYIRISKFSDNTTRDLRNALEEFKQQGAKGLVIDLRFNTGGLLKEAIDVSNLFLSRGKIIVSTKGRMKNQNQEFRAENDPATDLPMIVLINKGSASASEILAGAIKDHNRGIILGIKGQRSFGKGSVQTIEELTHSFEKDENGNYRPAAIRLTTAKYYTPSGISIDKVGVTPDIAVELPKGHEVDLLRHGMVGDPATDEDDAETTKSKFSWKKPNGNGEAATTTTQPGEESELDEDSITGSAVLDKKDDDSTAPKPKKIIPLDRTLFPTAEVEGDVKKPEPKKKANGKDFVDYQLEVAERLLHAHIAEGKDFYAAESGMPEKSGPALVEAPAPATDTAKP